jgi:hypothetical protein
LQERMLATRTLHFAPYEVLFECKTICICECGVTDGRSKGLMRSWPPPHFDKKDDHFGVLISKEWTKIAQDCSRRHFTFPEDVLPALSGIAQRTHPLRPGAYIAGMWEKGIAFQLSWYVVPGTIAEESAVSRPTFLWITASRSVRHDLESIENCSPLCTFTNSHTVQATADPFGKLADASLTLRGHCTRRDVSVCSQQRQQRSSPSTQTVALS